MRSPAQVFIIIVFLSVAILQGCGGADQSTNPPTLAAVPGNELPRIVIDSFADTITGGLTVRQWGRVQISGWAADKEDGAPLANVVVSIDSVPIVVPLQRNPRPDVIAATGINAWLNSGWWVSLNVEDLAEGDHTVTAVAVDSARGASTALFSKSFQVTANRIQDLQGSPPFLQSAVHAPLREEYIWGNQLSTAALMFRHVFALPSVPAGASLYVVGPLSMSLFLNGQPLTFDSWPENHWPWDSSQYPRQLVRADATSALHAGSNVLAIAATGEPNLAAKLVTAPSGTVLDFSNATWKISSGNVSDWQEPAFDDSGWSFATSYGEIENDSRHFEAYRDATMYHWPGYDGIAPHLAHLPRAADFVLLPDGDTAFSNVNVLTSSNPSAVFTVQIPQNGSLMLNAYPNLVLDFGEEVTGRIEFVSSSDQSVQVDVGYGESIEEVLSKPYIAPLPVTVAPRGSTKAPLSGFRYARVRFVLGPPSASFSAIRLDQVYYPTEYRGSFQASKNVTGALPAAGASAAIFNRIWQTGAYTVHLSMQDTLWDAPKRDRDPFAGDLNISGLVVAEVFGDSFLLRKTLDQLIADAGFGTAHVNGFPGYSAFWIMDLADYYLHFGDADYIATHHNALVALMTLMKSELNSDGLFVNPSGISLFVDWSPDLYYTDSPEARRATHFEYYRAFKQGAWLLSEMGDSANSAVFDATAQSVRDAANRFLLDSRTNTFGPRWQINAMAVYSGVADSEQVNAIWSAVLSSTPSLPITPYYNFYAITAMAMAGHRTEALAWLQQYWGGMVEEGATTFWEAYDLSWPKQDFHNHLQVAGSTGYFTSLCHGWSAGATAWLMQQILGITPIGAGFSRVSLRPYPATVHGTVPTPYGLITVDYQVHNGPSAQFFTASVELPIGTSADVVFPVADPDGTVLVNGTKTPTVVQAGSGYLFHLSSGSYMLATSPR